MIAPRIASGDARLRGWTNVHLTAAAPGCAELDIQDKRRWRAFERSTARQVVEAILRRLGKGPDDVSVRQAQIGHAGRDETEVEFAIETDQGVLPAAYVSFGLDLGDVRCALDDLSRQRWCAPAQPSLNW